MIIWFRQMKSRILDLWPMTGNSSKSWSSCILSPSLSSPCCRLLVSILLLSSEATRLMKTVFAWPLSPMSLAFYSVYKLQRASDEVRVLVGSNQQPRSIISDSSGLRQQHSFFFKSRNNPYPCSFFRITTEKWPKISIFEFRTKRVIRLCSP